MVGCADHGRASTETGGIQRIHNASDIGVKIAAQAEVRPTFRIVPEIALGIHEFVPVPDPVMPFVSTRRVKPGLTRHIRRIHFKPSLLHERQNSIMKTASGLRHPARRSL